MRYITIFYKKINNSEHYSLEQWKHVLVTLKH